MGKNIPLKIGLSKEIEQFVARKKTRSTRGTYQSAYQQFLIYYRDKHSGNATIPDFVEAVYDDLDKPLRERQRVAENELSGYVAFLQSLDPPKSNNTVRTYVACMLDIRIQGIERN